MKYTEGAKYRLDEKILINTKIKREEFSDFWMELRRDGTLWLRKGYVWDGASGIALDSHYTQIASATHDAFYRAIRNGKLDKKYRKAVDEEFRRLLLEAVDKMPDKTLWDKVKKKALAYRAHAWYYAVRILGRFYV